VCTSLSIYLSHPLSLFLFFCLEPHYKGREKKREKRKKRKKKKMMMMKNTGCNDVSKEGITTSWILAVCLHVGS